DMAFEMFEVHMFKTKKYHLPELIIIDVLLPGEDSFLLAKKLIELNQAKDIPVLFIVSSTDIANKKKIYQVGGKDYIEKPFVPEEVLTRIDSHLRYKMIRDELILKSGILEDNEKLLMKRSREIKGLHDLLIVLDSGQNTDDIMQEIVKRIIPEHLQYPDRTFCEIEVDKKVYSNFTNVYSTNNFSFIAPVRVNGLERGNLKVGYERHEAKYLSAYEKRMMEIYAHEIAYFIEKKELTATDQYMRETVALTLEAYQDGILLISKNGTIIRYNKKFLEMWGITDEIMKKEGPQKTMNTMKNKLENPEIYDNIFKNFMSSEKDFTIEMAFKKGPVYEVKGTLLPYSSGDKVYVWNFRDMTAFRRLQEELDRSRERIDQMKKMVRSKMI
ncbi:MAG TPA: response regulator, partial [Candidatus Aminicenantes bacterium]|nr:response regulator [Candidatus Aminicenantes bacterium]